MAYLPTLRGSCIHNLMKAKERLFLAVIVGAAVTTCLAATPARAFVFVGSWNVGDPGAPVWSSNSPNGPLAYTGQEAAAFLFGGSPGDYAISTVDDNPLNINRSAWYSVWGVGGSIYAETFSNKYLGAYYGPTNNGNGSASAYVIDNCGPQFVPGACGRNYAFRVPGPLPILGVGMAFGCSRNMRKRIKTSIKSDSLPAAI